MNFKEYDEIIEKHKCDMLLFEVYYNLTCNGNFKTLTDKEKEKIVYFVHRAYLKDESHIDLGYMCDKALEFKDSILKDDDNVFNTWDLLRECSYTF